MSIKQLKDGRYQVDIRPQGAEGKRIRKIFTLKSKAQDYEKYVQQNLITAPGWKSRLTNAICQNWLSDGGYLMVRPRHMVKLIFND